MPGLIVGVTGVAGCGKTTFSSRLVDAHGFQPASFAKPLKDECADRYGWDRRALDFDDAAQALGFESSFAYKEDVDRDLNMTRRQKLIEVASAKRAEDPDYYVKRCLPELTEGRWVIGDLRFLNEVQGVRAANGVIIRLIRTSREGVVTSAGDHASETEWRSVEPDFKFTPGEGIENVQSVADYFVGICHRQGLL